MDLKGLTNLKRELEGCRRRQPKAVELEALARQLGRERNPDRGKEPTYVSREFPDLRPLSIPNHKGKDIPKGTKNSILNQMEDDVLAWEERLGS